jgi:hypothetical protein
MEQELDDCGEDLHKKRIAAEVSFHQHTLTFINFLKVHVEHPPVSDDIPTSKSIAELRKKGHLPPVDPCTGAFVAACKTSPSNSK